MYHEFFGLNQAPFRITPDTGFFFSGANRGPILDALVYAICNGEGIVKVTGEVGTGKTMLCRMLETRLPDNTETVYLVNPSVSPDEILHAIAFELQLPVEPGTPRLQVMHRLHEFLLQRHQEGRRVVVFVEEAQGMPLATLEEIRLLSNLETAQAKLLQIVLFGQPELDRILARPDIRQLRDRITHSFQLKPLEVDEVADYLGFRLRTAGYHGPDLFDRRLAARITRAARGLTRRVNIIADKALLAAFADNTHTVRASHVRSAVRDGNEDVNPRRGWLRPTVVSAALLAGGMVAGVGLQRLLPEDARTPLAAAEGPAPSAGRIAAAPARRPEPPAVAHATPAAGMPGTSDAPPAAPPAGPAAGPPRASLPSPGMPAAEPSATEQPVAAVSLQSAAAVHAPGWERSAARLPPGDPLESRLAATRQWLDSAPGEMCTVQIAGVRYPDNLRDWLRKVERNMPIDNIYVFITEAGGQTLYTVLYGRFDDCRTAARVKPELPEQLEARDPILRTAQGIRDEISKLAAVASGS